MGMVELGRTGLRVSRLGLGLASIGGMFAAVPEPQAVATIDRAWELGVRLFDTAPVYGYGLSEQRAGLALRGRPRAEFVLCSKVGRLIEPGGPDIQPIWAEPPPGLGPRLDYSYGAVIRSFEASLERMGIDRIDILHIHDPDLDYLTASTEALRALAELRGRGTIRAISLGVNHADVAARFLRETGPAGPGLHPARRSVHAARPVRRRRAPAAVREARRRRARGRRVPGRRTGRHREGAPHGYARVPPTCSGGSTDSATLCRRYDVPLLAAALQFPLDASRRTGRVVGARSPREITEVAAWLDHEIPPGGSGRH